MKRLLQTFDAQAFKAKFRAAARARHIDPVEGATSYQAALVQAEQRRAATVSAPDYGWWRTHNLFGEQDGVVPTPRQEDEIVPFSLDAIRGLWREVARELLDVHEMPLKKLHQHQRAWEPAQRIAYALAGT